MSEEQLSEVEKLAGLFFAPKEICVVLEISEEEYLHAFTDTSTEIGKRYARGKLLAKAELRAKIKALAMEGSSPAQQLLIGYMEEQKQNEI